MDSKQQLYLKPDEAKFLAMSVMDILERIEKTYNNPKINWTPDSRKIIREMKEAGTGLKIKLAKLGFPMEPLPPFFDSDLDEFLTKES